MNEQTKIIIDRMWASEVPMPEALIKELECVENLCTKAGTKLLSKQVIASVIAPYLKE